MKTGFSNIALRGALFGGAALLLMAPSPALAGDQGESSSGFFSGPLLSRFLPSSAPPEESLSQQALPSRFRLGYFPPRPAAAENDHLRSFHQTSLPQMTALADVAYGSYYGAYRLDTNRSSLLGGISGLNDELSDGGNPALDENLSLSLEAGLRHQQLNTGILYAYQSGYPNLKESAAGLPPYPSYIFAPLGPVSTQHRDLQNPEGHAVFLYLGYNLSQQLNLRGTVGLAKTGSDGSDERGFGPSEQSRRWGLDFAATYRLLDNLVYQAHLGYVSIDETSAPPAIPSLRSTDGTPMAAGQGPDALYHIGSHIRMTF